MNLKKSLFLFLASASVLAFAQGKPPLKVYMAPKVPAEFAAKNMADPALWKDIPASSEFGLFAFGRKDVPQEKTVFRAAYNQNGIFLQIVCSEKLTGTLDFSRQQIERDNSPAVFSKPVVEVFLDPLFSRKISAQIVTNINGGIYDRLSTASDTWNHPVEVSVIPDKAKNLYTVYMAIPWKETSYDNPEVYIFSMTPVSNPVIGFNVGREQTVGGGELSQWNPTTVMFMKPEDFGALVLAGEPSAKQKMLSLFTDSVIAGGLDIQGAAGTAGNAIIGEILKNKLASGEKILASVSGPKKAQYSAEYKKIRAKFNAKTSPAEMKTLLNECVKLNQAIEKTAFESMKQEIFDEI